MAVLVFRGSSVQGISLIPCRTIGRVTLTTFPGLRPAAIMSATPATHRGIATGVPPPNYTPERVHLLLAVATLVDGLSQKPGGPAPTLDQERGVGKEGNGALDSFHPGSGSAWFEVKEAFKGLAR